MKIKLYLILIQIFLISACTNTGSYYFDTPVPTYREQLNFIVPDEVLADFDAASPQALRMFCSSKGTSALRVALQEETKAPVLAIKGYNSRMDNIANVPGAERTGIFVLRMSELLTDAWVNQNDRKKELALNVLYNWANHNALLETVSCTRNGNLLNECTEWTQSDGKDLSKSKDFATVQMWIMKLAYGYFFTLSDYKKNDHRHEIIQAWIGDFIIRNKVADNVYYGLDMGWYWPAIMDNVRRRKSPIPMIKKLLLFLDKLILPDGSIKDRTTRGNRALWYHHSAMQETMVSLEIARRYGVEIPNDLEERIQKSGEIFINGFYDHSYMNKWAKEAKNAIYIPNKQEFKSDLTSIPNAHSWFYIYAYRYPESKLTKKLEMSIRSSSNQAVKEGLIGFGLGCIYAAAK